MVQYNDASAFQKLLLRDVKRLMPTVVLASASEERKRILEELGASVITYPLGAKEVTPLYGDPISVARNNVRIKFKKFKSEMGDNIKNVVYPVIFADTVVAIYPDEKGSVFHKQYPVVPFKILGKPTSEVHAIKMMKAQFEKKRILVVSSMLIYVNKRGLECLSESDDTADIKYRDKIDNLDFINYIAYGSYEGAAGGCKIGTLWNNFVDIIDGDASTIRGLSYKALYEALCKIDYP